MAVVDFSDSPRMLQSLDLKLGDRVYKVRPTADDLARMLRMRRAISASLAERARQEEDAQARGIETPEPRRLIEFLDDDDRVLAEDDEELSRMQLGSDVFDEMLAAGLPFPNIRRMGDYSYNYHVGGREYADAMLAIGDQVRGDDDPEDPSAFPKPSKSGRSTASGSRTKTASTSATGRSRNSSGKSNTARKATRR